MHVLYWYELFLSLPLLQHMLQLDQHQCHISDVMHHSQALQGLLCFGLTQVSGEDADDYKRTLRAQLKALIEREKDPLGPTEWVVCYIKPAASDPLSKGPRKVRTPLTSCPCVA